MNYMTADVPSTNLTHITTVKRLKVTNTYPYVHSN